MSLSPLSSLSPDFWVWGPSSPRARAKLSQKACSLPSLSPSPLSLRFGFGAHRIRRTVKTPPSGEESGEGVVVVVVVTPTAKSPRG